jgi:hypothetical protein
MDAIQIWKGAKRCDNGRDLSNFVYVEFYGEKIGVMEYGDGEQGVTYSFYRAADGRVVVHVVLWNEREDEDDIGYVYVFPDIQAAADDYRLHMERAGIIERRTLSLDEIDEI